MYYVYILRNPKGTLYKGFTSDLKKRVLQHNSIGRFRSYTQGKGPWKLVHSEEFETESEARLRENFFKSGKGRALLKQILDDYPPQADG